MDLKGGIATPIEQSLINRVVSGVKYIFTGDAPVWMSPMEPLAPVVPANEQESVAGRQFDYAVGYNTRITPRQEEPVSFLQMRQLADGYDLMRLIIETRKDQIAKLKWNIKPKDSKAKPDARCEALEALFLFPDKEHSWDDWLRMLLEDLFVLDAPALYVRPTVGGEPYSFEPIDGATIKRVIDEFGRTPIAPEPAYQQIFKGVPAINYTTDELIYKPRNPRTHKVYGYSPVEQVIMTVNIALRRQMHQLQYYSNGSTPDLIFSVPATWQPDQIGKFKQWWDSILLGNTANRRGTMFVPDGAKPIDTKERALKDEYDEWLARIVCFAFSVAPTPFIKSNNRATADNAKEQALQEGLEPIMQWVKGLINTILVRHLGVTDLEFCWNEEEVTNPVDQATINNLKVRNATMTINEARAMDGMDAIDGGDLPMIYTANGAVLLDDVLNPPEPQQQLPITEELEQNDNKTKYTKPLKSGFFTSIVKSKKKVQPIDKERPEVLKARADFKSVTDKVFANVRKSIAEQLGNLINKVDKKDIDRILEQLDFSGLAILSDDYEEIYDEIVKDGAAKALAQIGMADDDKIVNLVNEEAANWAKSRAAEMVGKKYIEGELVDNPDAQWQIEESTRSMLRDFVTNAIDQGLSTDELADQIQDEYAFSDARADTIARTETAYADSNGNLIAWQNSGVVDGKEWLTAPDCCDICDELNGEVVALDDSFSDGADMPPDHPNCRCTFLPVINDDKNSDNEED